jgi:ribosome-binding factor A
MSQGSRPNRVADQLRAEITDLVAREVHDPGVGFLTITHVKVTPDLQTARVYYTTLGDDKARRDTQRALERATPFLRRHIGSRLRLKRVPALEFFFDEAIERGDRIEQILQEISAERLRHEKDLEASDPAKPDESNDRHHRTD